MMPAAGAGDTPLSKGGVSKQTVGNACFWLSKTSKHPILCFPPRSDEPARLFALSAERTPVDIQDKGAKSERLSAVEPLETDLHLC